MNINKLQQTLNEYTNLFHKGGIEPRRYPDDALATDCKLELQHCAWMLEEMKPMVCKLVRANRDCLSHEARNKIWDKLNRWLGFIQGVLWVQSVFDIETLRSHNRSDDCETLTLKEDKRGATQVWQPGVQDRFECDR